ncbi:hypothetical protein C366_05385 [Cryptococcus neoformans Tu401-1]|nr:hypothetical protein C366_05385 [Cryptococcus neoformans var. grubii Tu401-1]
MSDTIDLTNIIDDDHTPTLIIEDRWITHIQHAIDKALHHAVTWSEFLLFGDMPILRHDADLIRSLHRATRYGLTHCLFDDLMNLMEIIIHILDDQPVYIFQTPTSTFEHSLDDILQSDSLTVALHNYLHTNTHLPGAALGQLQQH